MAGAGVEILLLILQTVFNLYIIALIARFMAQLGRADFYNPLAQTILKVTNPMVLPLRKIIPGFGGIDVATLISVYVSQLLYAAILSALYVSVQGSMPYNFAQLALFAILGVAAAFIMVIFWSMIIVMIASWVSAGNYNPLVVFVAQMIEPFIGPFRRLNLQVGVLDLSFMVAAFVLYILQNIILTRVAITLGYQGGMFIGL